MTDFPLVPIKVSRALDAEAQAEWGFHSYGLIEAAGRGCAQVFEQAHPDFFGNRSRITVAAGPGHNGADAMIMLRYWLLAGHTDSHTSAVVLSRYPKRDDTGPWVELVKSLRKMKVHILVWNGDIGESAGHASHDYIANSDLIIDGIAGTGLSEALKGTAFEMVKAINTCRKKPRPPSSGKYSPPLTRRPFVVSVDLPSGNSDHWEPGMPIIEADMTLAIEPIKYCLYTPAARPYGGMILPVGGIFPKGIISSKNTGVELLDWERAKKRISKIRPDAYKNDRGAVEIRAGSHGTTGAAMIAARGAQAAGAGLIRLVADDDIYPILASKASGIMVESAEKQGTDFEGPRRSDAILLGPGWGKTPDRSRVLEKALLLEIAGTPLILDADAIELARDTVFNGNTILTPHPGEFSKFTGVSREELMYNPAPILTKYSQERKALILFKGHVITIAAPDGRMGVVDGMTPGLAAGGSGDILAGFCAAIAARMVREGRGFDSYNCAAAAATLLIEAGRSDEFRTRFSDPMELACKAAELAGAAWLSMDYQNDE